jgi:hypothetical protein
MTAFEIVCAELRSTAISPGPKTFPASNALKPLDLDEERAE